MSTHRPLLASSTEDTLAKSSANAAFISRQRSDPFAKIANIISIILMQLSFYLCLYFNNNWSPAVSERPRDAVWISGYFIISRHVIGKISLFEMLIAPPVLKTGEGSTIYERGS